MNWDAIGAISETLGAMGVIASLIYLASQLRSNAMASAVEAKLTTTRFLTDFNRDLINDPELYDLWERGAKDLDSLERREFARFSNLNLNAFWFFSAGHYQKRVGTLDDNEFHEMESIMMVLVCKAWRASMVEKIWTQKIHPRFCGIY